MDDQQEKSNAEEETYENSDALPLEGQNPIEIITKENLSYTFPPEILRCSKFISSRISQRPGEIICDVELTKEQIEFVKKYLEIHEYDLQNSKTGELSFSQAQADLIQHPQDQILFNDLSIEEIQPIFKAASYLDIKELLNLCMMTIASKINIPFDINSQEEFRQAHNIPDIDQNQINILKQLFPQFFMPFIHANNNQNRIND